MSAHTAEKDAARSRGPELRSVAKSIESVFPSAADMLRGIARELDDARHGTPHTQANMARAWDEGYTAAERRSAAEQLAQARRQPRVPKPPNPYVIPPGVPEAVRDE